ncbi:glycosyltransferase family 4 protein [Clostridium perfringens]|uniref:glycosyltransferase family 4 protein n=1 Tax=Clostridium perfringens TaxID=1502 RepID=UPI0013E3D93F|nr:glycosyltransferase family 4 protein [Clostridium perfringens]NGU13359.1 glycosyltransferase family 4 protein [Clostridium perfringens]
MKVVLCGRDDHSRYLAKKYQDEDVLVRYYNFYYYKNNILGKFINKYIYKNVVKRNKVILNENLVKNFLPHKIINLIIRKILFFNKNKNYIANKISDACFDFYISLTIEEADIYHLWSQYSLRTIKKIKKKFPKAKIILEVYCAHPNYREKIYGKNHVLQKEIVPQHYMVKRINEEIKLADIINVSSEHVKVSILDQINISDEKIKVIPYATDINNFFKEKNIKESKKIKVLFVGAIAGHKGVNYLVDAIRILNDELNLEIELNLIGEVWGNMEEKISQNEKYIKKLGKIPNGDLRKYYNSNDIFVFPSLSESMGLALSEAMACGMPVITTRNARWIVKDRFNGIIIKENSEKEIIEAIKLLIHDTELREFISNNAEITSRNYNWNDYFEQFKNECIGERENE